MEVCIMMIKPRVVVDDRERSSGIPSLLRKLGLPVEYRMLDVGDYLIFPYVLLSARLFEKLVDYAKPTIIRC